METMTMKRCSRCKQELPVTEFNKQQGKKGGLQGYCRECTRAYKREYRKKNAARNPDEIPIPPEKRCPGCGVTRPVSEWPRDSTSPDGLESRCKPCKSAKDAKYRAENGEKERERKRRWREANPEKKREIDRQWRKANPDKVRAYSHRRRARKANANQHQHTPEDLIIFTRDYLGLDPEKCWYCTLEGRDSPAEEIDHLIPLKKGGSETVWNKRFACVKCNRSKGTKVWEAGQPMSPEAERIVAEQYLATRRWMIHKGLLNPAE